VASDSPTTTHWWDRLREQVPPEHAFGERRVMQSLIVAVLLVYNAEIVVRLLLDAPAVRVVIAYSFLNYPEVAWPFVPVLNRDALHLGANVLMLVVLAPVESRLSRHGFLVFVAVTAYVSVLCGALWSLTFTEKEFVAFYGISGTVFVMAGYGLVATVRDYRAGEELTASLVYMGVAVIGAVRLDLWALVTVGPLGLNMEHLSGMFTGISIGAILSYSRSLNRKSA
jgi:membrane associated rhomboid family serine protease